MKVIQLLPELHTGGVERGTLELGKYLTEHGHESLVLSNGGQLVTRLEQEGSTHQSLPIHRKSPLSLRLVPVLRKLFATENPDIVHARSRVPAWLTFLAWRKMNPATRPRFVTTVHGFNSVNAYSRIMTRGERVICVSQGIRKFVRANYATCPEDALRVIPRGIDPANYQRGYQPSSEWKAQWTETFPETRQKTLLVLPGRVTRLKGHADFMDLVKALADEDSSIHGVIAGDAPPKKQAYLLELKQRATNLGIQKKMTFTGHRSDLREILASADLVYSLSQKPESFGRTTLEALAMGTPVIGYNYGGVGEILDKLLPEGAIAPKNPALLLETTRSFLKSPPPIAPENPFTLERMLRKIVGTYEELLTCAPTAF